MTTTGRESDVSAALIALADTLSVDFDMSQHLNALLDHSVRLLETDAGGLLLAEPGGTLQLAAITSDDVRSIEAVQLAIGSGPCIDCFRTGATVAVDDIAAMAGRWPEFTRVAALNGIRSVHATPLRYGGEVIGVMNLFSNTVGALPPADVGTAQALADITTIGIMQRRMLLNRTHVADQLQQALESRVVIEQAKGMLAGAASTSMNSAFEGLRARARTQNRTIRSVAEDVVAAARDGRADEDAPAGSASKHSSTPKSTPGPPKGGLVT